MVFTTKEFKNNQSANEGMLITGPCIFTSYQYFSSYLDASLGSKLITCHWYEIRTAQKFNLIR